MKSWEVLEGDCRELMRELGDGSVDAVVTDPPYEINFMQKKWDASGIAYQVDVWREVLRILKPGGHLLAFGGTRTYHRLACAIEDAGFEIRDSIHWVTGQGFPKNLAVDKAIDEAAGAEREVVGRKVDISTGRPMSNKQAAQGRSGKSSNGWDRPWRSDDISLEKNCSVTVPATEAAKQWAGWGTSLKPSHEAIVLARKNLEGTVAQNVLKYGTGALNVDGCRVGTGTGEPKPEYEPNLKNDVYGEGMGGGDWANCSGRWPPNFVMSHSESCGDECAEGCPVAQMDRQSGKGQSKSGQPRSGESGNGWGMSATGAEHDDSGGASRFFPCFRYAAKASRRERDEGLGDMPLRSAGEVTNRKDGTAGLRSPRDSASWGWRRIPRASTSPAGGSSTGQDSAIRWDFFEEGTNE